MKWKFENRVMLRIVNCNHSNLADLSRLSAQVGSYVASIILIIFVLQSETYIQLEEEMMVGSLTDNQIKNFMEMKRFLEIPCIKNSKIRTMNICRVNSKCIELRIVSKLRYYIIYYEVED